MILRDSGLRDQAGRGRVGGKQGLNIPPVQKLTGMEEVVLTQSKKKKHHN